MKDRENQLKKKKQRKLSDHRSDIHVVKVLEGVVEKESAAENVFEEIMAQSFPFWKET